MSTLAAAFLSGCLHAATPVVGPLELDGPDVAAAVAPFTLALPQDEPAIASGAESGETASGPLDPFAEDTRFFIPYAFATFGEVTGDIYAFHFAVGYFLEDNFSVALEPKILFADAELGEDVNGGGLDLVFRYHFFRHERWSIFAEGAAGFFYMDDDFPPGGTQFNFNFYFSGGITYELNPRTHLIAAGRYYHISNARVEGYDRNIGFDSAAAYVGLMFPF